MKHIYITKNQEEEAKEKMEVQKMMWDLSNNTSKCDDDDHLPGYRFHPTDEELVRFYLRRKVENKPTRLELIKLLDIYKYDPWDLPKASGLVGEKEWYFFCRRGKKYRNSIRPNRVTKSGFWKATGIDKPIYAGGDFQACIGLKKSLVYYRGSAGKGTKTEWMMHEFRLPSTNNASTPAYSNIKDITEEAEVWTLCRIMKRNNSSRKYETNWHKPTSNKKISTIDSSSKTCSTESSDGSSDASPAHQKNDHQLSNSSTPRFNNYHMFDGNSQLSLGGQMMTLKDEVVDPMVMNTSYVNFWDNANEFEMLRSDNPNWDELSPMIDCVLNPSPLYRSI